VTGIINGCGSITAALGLVLVTWMHQSIGWLSVWIMLIIGTLVGCALLMPRVMEEMSERSNEYQPLIIEINAERSAQHQTPNGMAKQTTPGPVVSSYQSTAN